jgi:hypothetical protein
MHGMCHSRHRSADRPAAAPAPTAPPAPRDPGLRASDAERETAVSALREHGAAGRLDVEELEQRIGAAYAACTHGELQALLRDLPSAAAPPARRRAVPAPHRPRHVRHDGGWHAFLAVGVLLIAIWALSGAGYFWPAWALGWWALALVLQSPASRKALVPASLARRLRPR